MKRKLWPISFLVVLTLGCSGIPVFKFEKEEKKVTEVEHRRSIVKKQAQWDKMEQERARRMGVLATQPASADAHHKVAIQYYKMYKVKGDKELSDNAERYWHKALKLVPNHYKSLYNLGVLKYTQNNIKEAISFWERVVKVKPDFYRAHYNIGTYKQNQGLTHQIAAGRLEKSGDIKGAKDEQAQANLFLLLAVGSYKSALKVKPNHIKSLINLGLAYFELYRDKEMIETWQQGLKSAPNNIMLNYNIGIYYAGQVADWGTVEWKDQDKKDRDLIMRAVSHWKMAVLNNKPTGISRRRLARVLYSLGEFYDRIGDTDKALEHLKLAYRYDPKSPKIKHRTTALARKKRLGR